MIEVENVCKRYRGHRDVTPLDGVSLSVEAGEVVMISGSSGDGKSTLLRLLYGAERADSGSVRVFGHNTARLRRSSVALLRRRIGIVPQDLQLLEERSALDNVALALQVRALPGRVVRAQAAEALAHMGLGDACDVRVRVLSHGERQRVAIARALVSKPLLLLLDEPTSHLSPPLVSTLIETITGLCTGDTSALIATTDRQVLACGSRRGWRHFELADGVLHSADLHRLDDALEQAEHDVADIVPSGTHIHIEELPNVVPFPLARVGGAE